MKTRHRSSRPRRTRPHHSTPHDGSGPVADTPDFLDLLAQCPLTHEAVALKAGLAWPTAPYRTLGDAYLKVLGEQLRRDAQWKFPIRWPAERFDQLGSQEGRRHAVRTTLGRWVVSVGRMMVPAKTPPARVDAMMDEMKEELKKVETELNNVGSGLEELVIFDALLPLLTMKVWTAEAFRTRGPQSEQEHQIRMLLFLSLQAQLTSINKFLKRFLKEESHVAFIRTEDANLESVFGPAFRGLLAGVDLMNDNLAMLRPPPKSQKNRRSKLQQLTQQNTRMLHLLANGAAAGPSAGKIFDEVLWLAVEILKARRLKLVDHICPLLARALPLLFPPTVFFPGGKIPFPTTALAIQKRYSRRP